MGRPPNLKDFSRHPSIDAGNLEQKFIYGRNRPCLKVTCPHCGAERWWPTGTLQQQIRRENFNGQCRKCGQKASREGTFQTKQRKNGGRRRIASTGYVILGSTAVPPEHLPLFRKMQNRNVAVFEHKLVMAIHIGRPLESHELVDHMDGDKTNNNISNLRLYVRGKNMPGSGCGFGTYYHEWQMALAELRRIKGD